LQISTSVRFGYLFAHFGDQKIQFVERNMIKSQIRSRANLVRGIEGGSIDIVAIIGMSSPISIEF